MHMYFGCRTDADYFFKSDFEALQANGTLETLNVAFSRKQKEKVDYPKLDYFLSNTFST
jgi:sulfite reductase alpha subunit-like flavoprotein